MLYMQACGEELTGGTVLQGAAAVQEGNVPRMRLTSSLTNFLWRLLLPVK
jgi:hypothetical protein